MARKRSSAGEGDWRCSVTYVGESKLHHHHHCCCSCCYYYSSCIVLYQCSSNLCSRANYGQWLYWNHPPWTVTVLCITLVGRIFTGALTCPLWIVTLWGQMWDYHTRSFVFNMEHLSYLSDIWAKGKAKRFVPILYL